MIKHFFFLFLVFLAFTSLAQEKSDTVLIKDHLIAITKTEKPRNYKNIPTLDSVASYIFDEFSKHADTTYYQTFKVGEERTYRNVICVLGSENEKTIVVGAHYDVFGDHQGADDNATGVVGLLETVRLLKGKKLNYRLEFVAFTLEEPPFFRTEKMGSYIHAKSLVDNKVNVYGMVCLEMIGFFNDEKKSQEYPIDILSMFYGNKGNYITLVTRSGKKEFATKFVRKYKKNKQLRTKKFQESPQLTGIDFSDHFNYWDFGFSALMITDTSFYRNKHYHKHTDTIETLDIQRMSQVIDGVVLTLLSLK